GLTDESVPVEHDRLALVVVAADKTRAPYYLAKRYLDYLAGSIGVELEYREFSGVKDDPAAAPFEPKRSALVFDTKTSAYVGVVGEYRKAVRDPWKVSERVAGFEVNVRSLFSAASESPGSDDYQPLSRYPGTDRDICFQVDAGVSYAAVE